MIEAAAAIVTHPGSPVVLSAIQLLAWVPLARLTPPVVQAASMAWHWLLAATDDDLQCALLEEIASAWMASQRQGLGLFAEWSPGKGASRNSEDSLDLLQAIAAHHAWIIFFAEVWRSRRHDVAVGGLGIQSTFDSLISSSLGTVFDASLTTHPSSAGARFRLLRLALSYICQSARAKPDRNIGDITSADAFLRVVFTALGWFAEPVAWHEAGRETAAEAAAAVDDFAQQLRRTSSLIPADPALKELTEALGDPSTELLEQLLAAGAFTFIFISLLGLLSLVILPYAKNETLIITLFSLYLLFLSPLGYRA